LSGRGQPNRERDIHDLKRGTHERGEVEDIDERLILARAYERATAKRYDDPAKDFDAVADKAAAGLWLGRALAHADDLRGRAHGVRDREQLDVLWLAAQLTVAMGAPLAGDLPKRLEDASAGDCHGGRATTLPRRASNERPPLGRGVLRGSRT
jgi:hypothetical protein